MEGLEPPTLPKQREPTSGGTDSLSDHRRKCQSVVNAAKMIYEKSLPWTGSRKRGPRPINSLRRATALIPSSRPRSTPKKKRRKIGRTQEERSSATTAKIMAATQDCIFEMGFVGATTSAIAKKAGVTRGALQHHYGSRANLFTAFVDHFFKSLARLENPTSDVVTEQQRKNFLKDSFRLYGTALPVAIMLLRLNVQSDPELRDSIETKFATSNPVRNEDWNHLFRMSGLSASETELMRELVYAVLRGFAVRQAYRRKASSIDTHLSMFSEMVELYIARHSAPRAGSATRSRKSRPAEVAE